VEKSLVFPTSKSPMLSLVISLVYWGVNHSFVTGRSGADGSLCVWPNLQRPLWSPSISQPEVLPLVLEMYI
jgi:hypothetical protein